MMWQWCSRRSTAQAVMEPLGRMSSQSQNGWLLLARGSMFVMHKQIDLTPLSMSCRSRRHASKELSFRGGPLWPYINTGINWMGLSSGYCCRGQMSSALIGKRSLKWTQGWQWEKNHIAPSSQHP